MVDLDALVKWVEDGCGPCEMHGVTIWEIVILVLAGLYLQQQGKPQ